MRALCEWNCLYQRAVKEQGKLSWKVRWTWEKHGTRTIHPTVLLCKFFQNPLYAINLRQTSLLYLQAACSLQVALIKSNWQNESCIVEEALLYYGQSFFSTNISTKAGKNLLIGYDIDNITYLVSAISHATRTCSVLMFSQEYSRKKREKLQLYAAF